MPYVQKVVDCGETVFVKNYFATRYNTKGQIYRSKNENRTTAAQETVNDRNKVERFSILANTNFPKVITSLLLLIEEKTAPLM